MPAKKAAQNKPKKEKWLPHNKTLFKSLMPKSKYLEDIRFGEIDIPFLILVIVLLVMGLIMMYSASYAWAISDGYSPDHYFKRQMFMAMIGLIAMLVISSPLLDYHLLKNKFINYGFFIFCIILLILVHVPGIGITDGGADRWIQVGSLFSFQPSEFMKLSVIMLFAHMISTNHSCIRTFKGGILPYLFFLLIVAAFMLAQPHISGTIIICVIGLAMMFIGGVNLKYFIPICIAGAIALVTAVYCLYEFLHYDYIVNRIESWLNTFAPENKDVAWQTRNSLIAIGSGGPFGLGLGNSRQKFSYLPESKNDFVFSIVCEELGFVGASVVIILFLMLIFRGFKIAVNSPDKYGMLLASGISIQIGIQALLNIGVVTNTIPNTGISLPFFSYGGSALIMQLAQMGIILNISRQSIPRKEKADADTPEQKKLREAKAALGAGKNIRRRS